MTSYSLSILGRCKTSYSYYVCMYILEGNSSKRNPHTIPLLTSGTPHLTGELGQPYGDPVSATRSSPASSKHKSLQSSGEEKHMDAGVPGAFSNKRRKIEGNFISRRQYHWSVLSHVQSVAMLDQDLPL